MNASPAQRGQWDATRRWRTWAQHGDLAALQQAAQAWPSVVDRALLDATAKAAARAGQVAVLGWVLDQPQVQPPRWISVGWVTSAARARQWAVLTYGLARGLSPGAYPIALSALIRAGRTEGLVPHLSRTTLVGQRGTLLALSLRSPDVALREAALDRIVEERHAPGGPVTWAQGLKRAVATLLAQGQTTRAQQVLSRVGDQEGSGPAWEAVDAWLAQRSVRTQRSWLRLGAHRLPVTQTRVRSADLACRPATAEAITRRCRS